MDGLLSTNQKIALKRKKKLKPLILQSASADELIENIKDRSGMRVTAADVKTMKAQLSTGLQVFDILRGNGELREYSENGNVTRICLSTYERIELYNKYSEVVSIGCAYNTKNKKYSLF